MNLFSKMWCKLFGCQEFIDLKADMSQVRADLATVVIAVTGIAAQFPIVIPEPVVDLGNMPEDIDALLTPDLTVWAEINPMPIAQNEVLNVEVWVKGTAGSSIEAFGFGPAGFVFNPAHFSYAGFVRGMQTIAWNSADANEVNPGELTIGAFAGGARGLVGDKPMHLFTIRLTVATPDVVASLITLDNYVDDVADLLPKPFSFTVDLNGS